MTSIEDIKRELNESWASSPTVMSGAAHHHDRHHSHQDQLSSLAANLSAQMDYNNSLLSHIEALEAKLLAAERDSRNYQSELGQLERVFEELVDQNGDLQRNLHSSIESVTLLTQQSHDLRDELSHYSAKSDECLQEIERYKQRVKSFDEERSTLLQKNRELETSLHWAKASFQEESREGMTENGRLRTSLESATVEIEELKHACVAMEDELIGGRDENIKLQRATERLLRQVQDESFSREEVNTRNKELMAENNILNQRLNESSVKIEDLEDEIQRLRERVESLKSSQEAAADHAQKAEAMWRHHEEIAKQKEHALIELSSRCSDLEEQLATTERSLLSAEARSQEAERNLKETSERNLDSARERINELTTLLSQASARLKEERESHEEMSKTFNQQVDHLHKLLKDGRTDCEARIRESVRVRDDALARCERLEHDLCSSEDQLRVGLSEEQLRTQQIQEHADSLQKELIDRGSQFVTTLSLFQRAVRGLTEEAAVLRDDLAFVSSQYLKLLTIMKQLSRADQYVEEVLNDPNRPRSPAKLPQPSCPVLKPLMLYGLEIQECLEAITSKILDQQHSEKKLAQASAQKAQECLEQKLRLEQSESVRKVALDQVVVLQQRLIGSEEELKDSQRSHKQICSELLQERENVAAAHFRAEERHTELTKQNLVLQGDLTRMAAELSSVRGTMEHRVAEQIDKIKFVDKANEKYKSELAAMTVRCTQLQQEVHQAESKNVQIQADFQQLRKSAQTLGEMAANEKKRHQQQIAALSEAVQKYQNQLEQKQSLLDTIQAHRRELVEENSLLKRTGAAPGGRADKGDATAGRFDGSGGPRGTSSSNSGSSSSRAGMVAADGLTSSRTAFSAVNSSGQAPSDLSRSLASLRASRGTSSSAPSSSGGGSYNGNGIGVSDNRGGGGGASSGLDRQSYGGTSALLSTANFVGGGGGHIGTTGSSSSSSIVPSWQDYQRARQRAAAQGHGHGGTACPSHFRDPSRTATSIGRDDRHPLTEVLNDIGRKADEANISRMDGVDQVGLINSGLKYLTQSIRQKNSAPTISSSGSVSVASDGFSVHHDRLATPTRGSDTGEVR